MSLRLWCIGWFVVAWYAFAAGPSYAQTKSYDPWEIASSGFNGGTHSIGYIPPSPAAPAGIAFAGGDDGGAYRSLDCGDTWEPANGGPPVSDGVGGGYPVAVADGVNSANPWANPCACNPNQMTCADSDLCHHGIVYGGPPSMEEDAVGVSGFESGPLPAAFAILSSLYGVPVGPVAYRVGVHMYFSMDGGSQWFPLPPTCTQGATRLSHFQALAADPDPSAAGHLVAVAATGTDLGQIPTLFDASGCTDVSQHCATRQVAWTENSSDQMMASFAAASNSDSGAEYEIDRQSHWHFASLAYLATSADWSNADACAVQLPAKQCSVRADRLCHGRKPDPDHVPREDACLDKDDDLCKCVDQPSCRYPAPVSVQIDPRNGWSYLTSESGLFVSVPTAVVDDQGQAVLKNGQPLLASGRDWARGPHKEKPAPGTIDADKHTPASPLPPLRPEAPKQGSEGPYGFPPAPVRIISGNSIDEDDYIQDAWLDTGFDAGFDLNLAPWRIERMGKMSMVFEPLPGNPLNALGRVGGSVTAYVTIDWITAKVGPDGKPKPTHHSSVFMAHSEGGGEDLPLVFRDVNNLQVLHILARQSSALPQRRACTIWMERTRFQWRSCRVRSTSKAPPLRIDRLATTTAGPSGSLTAEPGPMLRPSGSSVQPPFATIARTSPVQRVTLTPRTQPTVSVS